jgi:hypothetical protein
MIFKNIVRKIIYIYFNYTLRFDEWRFILYNLKKKKKLTCENIVLVQMPEDHYYLVLFSFVARFFSSKLNAKIGFVNVALKTEKRDRSDNILKKISFYLRINPIAKLKWSLIYLSFGQFIALDNSRKSQGASEKYDQIVNFFQGLETKEELLQFELEGVLLGDLVYDNYLRFKPAPTVDLRDPYLLDLLKACFDIFHNSRKYFEENQVKAVVTSYASYIKHGVLVRAALKYNVAIYSVFSSRTYFIRKIHKSYPFHLRDYFLYHESFKKCLTSAEKLEIARQALEGRFRGELDSAVGYMRKSSYHQDNIQKSVFEEKKGPRAVVFLHCFFDSPHIYRNMLFPDFVEWIEYTLKVASETDFDFYVKPHPNGIHGNDEIVSRLKEKYSKIHFLSSKISNKQIIKEGIDAAFTVYGTLAHEFAYFGVPVINAGDNPHINYSFCFHPSSIQEYTQYLKNFDSLKLPENTREQILEFYYMHNIQLGNGKMADSDPLNIHMLRTGEFKHFSNFVNKMKHIDEKSIFDKIEEAHQSLE